MSSRIIEVNLHTDALQPLNLYERYWEDFPEGTNFKTRGLTVTESHVVVWSMVAGDWLPIHVDHEHASDSVFGEPVAHGPLTLSLALGLVVQSGAFGNSVMAWLGLDEVRLPAPVRFGDTISVEATVEEHVPSSSKPDRGRVRFGYEVTNQEGVVVLTYKTSFLMHRRPKSAPAASENGH